MRHAYHRRGSSRAAGTAPAAPDPAAAAPLILPASPVGRPAPAIHRRPGALTVGGVARTPDRILIAVDAADADGYTTATITPDRRGDNFRVAIPGGRRPCPRRGRRRVGHGRRRLGADPGIAMES